MIYPFVELADKTEIVHSEMKEDGRVMVCIEKPVENGFKSAICWLPNYEWEDVSGYTDDEIKKLETMIPKWAHLIIRFSHEGGFNGASGF